MVVLVLSPMMLREWCFAARNGDLGRVGGCFPDDALVRDPVGHFPRQGSCSSHDGSVSDASRRNVNAV